LPFTALYDTVATLNLMSLLLCAQNQEVSVITEWCLGC